MISLYSSLKCVNLSGPSSPLTSSPSEEEAKEKPDAMPNISDVMLRKLKLHRGLPGWCVHKTIIDWSIPY